MLRNIIRILWITIISHQNKASKVQKSNASYTRKGQGNKIERLEYESEPKYDLGYLSFIRVNVISAINSG